MRYITPAIIAAIVALALIRKKAVYGDFTDGARGGLGLLADIFPPLVAILTATSMLRASGAMDVVVGAVRDAVASGEIDDQRHGRYVEILSDMRQRWRERYD